MEPGQGKGKGGFTGGKELEETHEVSPPSVLVSPYRLLGFSRACVWGYGEEGDGGWGRIHASPIVRLSAGFEHQPIRPPKYLGRRGI